MEVQQIPAENCWWRLPPRWPLCDGWAPVPPDAAGRNRVPDRPLPRAPAGAAQAGAPAVRHVQRCDFTRPGVRRRRGLAAHHARHLDRPVPGNRVIEDPLPQCQAAAGVQQPQRAGTHVQQGVGIAVLLQVVGN